MSKGSLLKLIIGIVAILFLASGSFYFYEKYQNEKRKAEVEKSRIERQKKMDIENEKKQLKLEEKKESICNEFRALQCFNKYMGDYYPDYRIISPSVSKRIDCVYSVTFRTIDPHFTKYGQTDQEVIVVDITFDTGNDQFYFKTVRGVLY